MSNSIGSIISKMQQMQESQDGTLNGGYLSITSGRYRIIIDPNGPAPGEVKCNAANCGGSTNDYCRNDDCPNTTNNSTVEGNCDNGCCVATRSSISNY